MLVHPSHLTQEEAVSIYLVLQFGLYPVFVFVLFCFSSHLNDFNSSFLGFSFCLFFSFTASFSFQPIVSCSDLVFNLDVFAFHVFHSVCVHAGMLAYKLGQCFDTHACLAILTPSLHVQVFYLDCFCYPSKCFVSRL